MTPLPPPRPVVHLSPAFQLNDGPTVFGSDHQLPAHPRIAGRHFVVTPTPTGGQLRDLGAGTGVNGRRVFGRAVDLRPGDEVDVGPLAMRFTGAELESVATMHQVVLTADRLTHTVPGPTGPRHLLHDISLVLRPGEFTCILGSSGCGKSTLLGALAGPTRPPGLTGRVLLNHRDLHARFDQVKHELVLVPQQTVVRPELTVHEVLRYTARLRLPASAERATRVDQLLTEMGLDGLEHQPVHRLSGGELKRLCLANELLSDPGLVLLDEVTSGLDEASDRDIMRRLRGLADRGKTVVCVTHTLAHVAENCHLVVVLGPGGRLAYIGPPGDAVATLIQTAPAGKPPASLGDIYNLFGGGPEDQRRKAEGFAERCRDPQTVSGRLYAKYVTCRMMSEPQTQAALPSGGRASVGELKSGAVATARQTLLCLLRSVRVFRRDRGGLASLVVQTLVVAGVLIAAFGNIGEFRPAKRSSTDRMIEQYKDYVKDEVATDLKKDYVHQEVIRRTNDARRVLNLTFLMGVTCFWFGCNNAAKELVRERAVITAEQRFNLRATAVLLSKLVLLTVAGWTQVVILLAAVWGYCLPPVDPWAVLPVLLGLAFVGTTLGLAISAVAPSEGVAVAAIPVAVIPQIVLSSAIVTLSGLTLICGQTAVTMYWGKYGLDAAIPVVGKVDKPDTDAGTGDRPLSKGEKVDKARKADNPDKNNNDDTSDEDDIVLLDGGLGDFARHKKIKLIDAPSGGWILPFGFLGLHATVFCGVALVALRPDCIRRWLGSGA